MRPAIGKRLLAGSAANPSDYPSCGKRRSRDYRRRQKLRYREFNRLVDNLASSLRRRGLKRGETALVQLGNVAEFYITFFALLRIGVAPVNALFSHQRSS